MARKASMVAAMIALLLLSSCSGYREIPRPWNFDEVQGDFESSSVIHAGDMVRLTASGGAISEGIFVETDGISFTIAETSEEARIVTIPFSELKQIEVFQNGSGRALRAVALIATTSIVVHAIVQAESGPVFGPDDGSPAKTSR